MISEIEGREKRQCIFMAANAFKGMLRVLFHIFLNDMCSTSTISRAF